MKANQTKKSEASNTRSSKPFFHQNGIGNFFSNSLQAEQRFFSPSGIQAKLTIGQPGDKYEQEADATADRVIQRLEAKPTNPVKPNAESSSGFPVQKMEEEQGEESLMTKSLEGSPDGNLIHSIQKKSLDGNSSGDPSLQDQLSSSKGSGSPLSKGTRQDMESAFGADFSGVKIHTDANSVQMSQQIHARAFTHGSDIYFNRGEYGSSTGQKRLLAHELTHTIQQGAAKSIQTKEKPYHSSSLNLQQQIQKNASLRIQRVPTHFGDFDSINYGDVKSKAAGTPEVGVNMHLKFAPNSNVDSTKIGLVQIAQGKRNGTQITSGIYGRRTSTSGAGQGSFIDRVAGKPNPVYGSNTNPRTPGEQQDLGGYNAPAPTALTPAQQATFGATGITHGGGSTYGHRFTLGGAIQGPVNATLHDAPHMIGAGNNSEQVFETTALAISGNQQGTYYGSVQWGWRRDGAGTFTRLPLTIKSMGVPSNEFMTAAAIWNSATEDIGRETTAAVPNLPVISMASGAPVVVPGSAPVTVPANVPLQILVEGTNGAGISVIVARVPVGGSTITTIIPESSTHQVDIGRPTVNLPIVNVKVVTGNSITLVPPVPFRNITLPVGTRVEVLTPWNTPILNQEVKVIDGPETGMQGEVNPQDMAHLMDEVRGTR